MQVLLIQVASAFVVGGISALYAPSKGRSSLNWFFIGLFFGVFGLLLLFLLPSLKKDEEISKGGLPAEKTPSIEQKSQEVSPHLEEIKKDDWFYLDGNKKPQGPCTRESMKEKWQQGSLSQESWVWNESIVVWKKIADVSPLLHWLQS
jgi:hypothetical protein